MDTRTTTKFPGESSVNHKGKEVLYKRRSTLKLKDPKSLEGSLKLILASANIDDMRIVSTVLTSTARFYSEFVSSSVGLGTRQLKDHFDACKRRAKLLTELDQKIQSSDFSDWEEYGIIRRSFDGSHYSPFKGKWENRLTISYFDSDEVSQLFELRIDPKCYKPLFLGLYTIIQYIADISDESTRERDNEVIHIISSIFVSVGMLYTTMRSNLDYAKSCIDQEVEKINVSSTLSRETTYKIIKYFDYPKGIATRIPSGTLLNSEKNEVSLTDIDPMDIIAINPEKTINTEITLYEVFQSVKADIQKAVSIYKEAYRIQPRSRSEWLSNNYPTELGYVRDLAKSAAKVDFTRMYDPDRDDHISMKSSGTSFKGRSLPSLYASLVEVDRYYDESKEFDSHINYVSEYTTETRDYVFQNSNCMKSVEPPSKIDVRPIFIVDNPQQDRLNWFHNILMDVLNGMDTDCTSNQYKSVRFLKKRSAPEYRRLHHNAIYTLDISDATNTCSLEFQEEVLKIFFPDWAVSWWIQTMKNQYYVYYPQSSKHHRIAGRKRGQSQGGKSSFPAFALMHHICYLIAIKLKGWVEHDANRIYRLIGDDSGASTIDPDRDLSFRNAYIQVCRWMGWVVNPSKGFSAPADSNIAFAEMAKVRILNGRINTPIPPRLLIKGDSSPIDTIALSKWFSQNYLDGKLNIDIIINNSNLSLRNDLYKSMLRKIVAIAPSDAFNGLYSEEQYTDQEEALVLLHFAEEQIESTLLNELLPEHAQTDKERFSKNYGKYGLYTSIENFHLSGIFWSDDIVQNSPSGKYTRLYNRHEDLIHALQSSLGIRVYEAESIMALRLSDGEIKKILDLLSIIQEYREDRTISVSTTTVRELTSQVSEILGRYQDRSDVRRNLSQAFFADAIIEKMIVNQEATERVTDLSSD